MAEVHASEQNQAGHELSDLSPKNISLFGVGLAALIIVALLAVYGVMMLFRYRAAERAERPVPLSVPAEPRAGPELSVDAGQSMKAIREQEERRLRSYGWIDEEKGIVHIPIERAIEMLAKKGLPARPGKPPVRDEKKYAAEQSGARQERQP